MKALTYTIIKSNLSTDQNRPTPLYVKSAILKNSYE